MSRYYKVDFEHAPGGYISLSAETIITREGFGTEARVHPVTIVRSRYNGTYEGGFGAVSWLAFPVRPLILGEGIWSGWNDSDIECAQFWDRVNAERWPIGRGASPSAANDDLIDQVCAMAGVDRADLDHPPTWDRDEMKNQPGMDDVQL